MISDDAWATRTYPNQAIFPALALAISMFAFNFLGDGLRDALDPACGKRGSMQRQAGKRRVESEEDSPRSW